MKTLIIATAMLLSISGTSWANSDWIVKKSPHTASQTADLLVAAVEKAGAKVFAKVDHAVGAKAVGAELDPTILVVFGNPKIGTPIIEADRRAALDLPIRVLIWEADGATSIGYEKPEALKARYSINGADKSFATMTGALNKLTDAAIQ